MSSQGYDDRQGPRPIDTNGIGVPGLFDYLLRRDRPRFFKLVDEVKRLVPGVQDIEITTPEPTIRRLDLVLEAGFRIPADQASPGVRLLLFFISLAYHPDPPKLILLEEPETGVHPRRLSEVIRLLRGITEGTYGGHVAQVVLSTHSPYLLDCLDIEKDQVLVFRREEDGRRTVEPADAERLKLFLDEFMLGEVWYNQGEEGLVADHAASLRG
jgi:predicted ATPase